MKRIYYVKRWWPSDAHQARPIEYMTPSYEDPGTAIVEADRLYAERGADLYEVAVVIWDADRGELETVWSSSP